jgi:hypothetical protein
VFGNYLDVWTVSPCSWSGLVLSNKSTLLVMTSLKGPGTDFPTSENFPVKLYPHFFLILERKHFFWFTINKVFWGQDPNEIITMKAAIETSMFENTEQTGLAGFPACRGQGGTRDGGFVLLEQVTTQCWTSLSCLGSSLISDFALCMGLAGWPDGEQWRMGGKPASSSVLYTLPSPREPAPGLVGNRCSRKQSLPHKISGKVDGLRCWGRSKRKALVVVVRG